VGALNCDEEVDVLLGEVFAGLEPAGDPLALVLVNRLLDVEVDAVLLDLRMQVNDLFFVELYALHGFNDFHISLRVNGCLQGKPRKFSDPYGGSTRPRTFSRSSFLL